MESEGDEQERRQRMFQRVYDELRTMRSAWDMMEEQLARYNDGLQTFRTQMLRLESIIRSIEYQNWTDEDSPKGETVPGVRHPDTRMPRA